MEGVSEVPYDEAEIFDFKDGLIGKKAMIISGSVTIREKLYMCLVPLRLIFFFQISIGESNLLSQANTSKILRLALDFLYYASLTLYEF